MPIKGLTNERMSVGSGLPLIAKLFKGGEKPENGKRPGADLDYFRVEFDPQFAHLAPVFAEMYGAQPTEFSPIYLMAQRTDDAFSSWREEWDGSGGLIHRCDGQTQVNWRGDAGQTCEGQKACAAPSCKCKPIGRLKFLLPEFIDATGVLGYISVNTHSVNDILTIHRYLADIERLYGTLTQVPFVFGRAVREVSAPRQVKQANGSYANDGRIKTNKSLFYIHAHPTFTQQHLLPALAGNGQQQPALPAPVVDSDGVIQEQPEAPEMKWFYHPESESWVQMTVEEFRASAENGLLDGPHDEPITPHPSMAKRSAPAPETGGNWSVAEGDALEAWIHENTALAAKQWKSAPGILYNAALNLIYSGNVKHMQNSIPACEKRGILTPDMTVAQALIALAKRNEAT